MIGNAWNRTCWRNGTTPPTASVGLDDPALFRLEADIQMLAFQKEPSGGGRVLLLYVL